MRKILILLCAAAMLLCSCADKREEHIITENVNKYRGNAASHSESTGAGVPESFFAGEVMSYDEIMRLPTVRTSACDRELLSSLDEYVNDFIERTGRPCAFVSGVCVGKTHYLGVNEYGYIDGYTVSAVKIVDFAGAYNGFEINIGDTVLVRQDYYVRPADDEATLEFLIENGIAVSSEDGIDAMNGTYCEFIPYAGGDYEKCVGWNEVPMNPGEEYTFEIHGTEIYTSFLVHPVTNEFYPTSTESLLIKNNFYDIRPDEDILAVSRELCGLVKQAREK